MTERKLRVMFVSFCYGGNGGLSMVLPHVMEWMIKTVAEAKEDKRVEQVIYTNIAETPITMARNRAVVKARQAKVDVLVMIDSDQEPDLYLDSDPSAKPFFQSSFDFLYDNWDTFPAVIASPYCGPPPHPVRGGGENVYVFQWEDYESGQALETPQSLEQFTRRQASRCIGIEAVAALPTGLCMFAMPAFELTEPKPGNRHPGWFYYEYEDQYGAVKASTEDVTATRDMAIASYILLGHSCIYVNWDAWAGHAKVKMVGRPAFMSTSAVGGRIKDSIFNGVEAGVREVKIEDILKHAPPQLHERMRAAKTNLEATDGIPEKPKKENAGSPG